MKNFFTVVTAAALLFATPIAAFSQTGPTMVTFGGNINQPSLEDDRLRDNFNITLSDARLFTEITVECQAGRMNFGILRQDEACSVVGNGSLINPNNPSNRPLRTQYNGGFTVTKTGDTSAESIGLRYLQVGSVPAGNATFEGSVTMMPEIPSSNATAIFEIIRTSLPDDGSTTLINENLDSIEFNRFFVPSAGYPSDGGCVWNGDMVFVYANDSWAMDLEAECTEAGVKTAYELKGNMPWVASPGVENQSQYDLILALPSATAVGDDAFFTTPAGDDAFFAAADGISGTIIMAESGYVDVDGEALPKRIELSGSLQGNNVPLNVVRSFSTIIAVFSRTFFGA